MSVEMDRAAQHRLRAAERWNEHEAALKIALARLKAANEAHEKAHEGLAAFQEEYRCLLAKLADDPLSAAERLAVVARANALLDTFENYKVALQRTSSERGTASQQVTTIADRVGDSTRALLNTFPTIEELAQ